MSERPPTQPTPDQAKHAGSEHAASERETSERTGWFMIFVRYVLPAAVTLGGVVVMLFGSEIDLEGGAGIVSAGLAIYAANWLYRASVEGDQVRVQEEEARIYLDVHGHWPDEAPGPRHEAEIGNGGTPPDQRIPEVQPRRREPAGGRELRRRPRPRR